MWGNNYHTLSSGLYGTSVLWHTTALIYWSLILPLYFTGNLINCANICEECTCCFFEKHVICCKKPCRRTYWLTILNWHGKCCFSCTDLLLVLSAINSITAKGGTRSIPLLLVSTEVNNEAKLYSPETCPKDWDKLFMFGTHCCCVQGVAFAVLCGTNIYAVAEARHSRIRKWHILNVKDFILITFYTADVENTQ